MEVSNPWAVFLHGAVWELLICHSCTPTHPAAAHTTSSSPSLPPSNGLWTPWKSIPNPWALPGVQPEPPESTNASPCHKQCSHIFSSRSTDPESINFIPRPTDINTRAITEDAAAFTPLCCISILLCFTVYYLIIIFLKCIVLMYLKQSN